MGKICGSRSLLKGIDEIVTICVLILLIKAKVREIPMSPTGNGAVQTP